MKTENVEKPTRKVIVLRGISGAGKSTYAQNLESQSRAGSRVVVVSADHYFVQPDGSYKFLPEKLSQAHAACFRNFMSNIMLEVETIVVDNTNITSFEISPYMLASSAYGYDAEIHQLRCEASIAYGRSLHGVSAERTVQMARSLESERLLPWWSLKLVAARQLSAPEVSS